MALQTTSRVRIYFPLGERDSFLALLQESSLFHPRVLSETGKASDSDFGLDRMKRAIDFLSSQKKEEKKTLREKLLGIRIEYTVEEEQDVLRNFDVMAMVDSVLEAEDTMKRLMHTTNEKKLFLKGMQKWKGVKVKCFETSRIRSFFVELPLMEQEGFFEEVGLLTKNFEKELLSIDDRVARYVFFALQEEVSSISSLISEKKGVIMDMNGDGSPAEVFSALEKEIEDLKKEVEILRKEIVPFFVDIRKLKISYDEAAAKMAREKLFASATQVGAIAVLDGFVPSDSVDFLKATFEEKFPAVQLEVLQSAKPEKENPVLYRSSSVMRPMQEITKMYGTPNAKEIDPTPFHGFFFVFFFAFCLTDAGYGTLISLATGVALAMNLPLGVDMRNMIKLFFYGGLMTIVLGALFGGWFGLTTAQVPEFLTYVRDDGSRLFLGQIFDPMKDLVSRIMPMTYLIGIIHLSLGFYLSGYIEWKNGNKNKMIFVSLPLIFSFIFAIIAFAFGIDIFKYALYGSLGLLVWGLGKSGNPIIRILKGVFGLLNEGISMFSNLLSYSRLFALGLSTGIIAMAFNIVAASFAQMAPGIFGVIIMIIVLFFGHSLNIALNLLGAHVHSSRLQFVEFFGLFFEGGGIPFKPFQKEYRYRFLSTR